jgi:hypothetical protein
LADTSLEHWIMTTNELHKIGADLWERTTQLEGWVNDPRMVSARLFNRGWSNARSFNLLWSNNFTTDAEIILRAAFEVAICLANLKVRPAEFVADLTSDTAATLAGQIPLWAKADAELGEAAKESASIFGERRSDGSGHAMFRWKTLATDAGKPHLYEAHKHLSGNAAHVTGLSLLTSIADVHADDPVARRRDLDDRRGHALGMASDALGTSIEAHASIIGANDILDAYGSWTDLLTGRVTS